MSKDLDLQLIIVPQTPTNPLEEFKKYAISTSIYRAPKKVQKPN